MASEFVIKQGDLLPPIKAVLETEEGAFDLTGKTVYFVFGDLEGTNIFRREAAVVTAAEGIVQYMWQSGDTDDAGRYRGEFEVVDSSTKPRTFPHDTYIPIRIVDDCG